MTAEQWKRLQTGHGALHRAIAAIQEALDELQEVAFEEKGRRKAMTQQAMARRLTDAGDDASARFETDARIGAAKEESSIRAEVQARNFMTRLDALAKRHPNGGLITVCWKDGLVGCSLANGVQQGASAGKPSITSAIDGALIDLGGEVGF